MDDKSLSNETTNSEEVLQNKEGNVDSIQSPSPVTENTQEQQNITKLDETVIDGENLSNNNEVLESKEKGESNGGKKEFSKNIKLKDIVVAGLVIIILIIIWFSANNKDEIVNQDQNNNDTIIKVDDKKEEGTVNIIGSTGNDSIKKSVGENEIIGNQVKIIAFFGNSKLNPESVDCSSVFPVERLIENKYNSNLINTTRGLLESLSSEETELGYYSAIPAGTFLKNINLTKGIVEVNFTSGLNKIGGSCAVQAVRSQIEKTLMQFKEVQEVKICVDGNCNQDEILQP